MKFEYDPNKAKLNENKHGISFETIKQLWEVPSVILQAKTVGESRYMIIGRIDNKLYSCIYTVRVEIIRLISARRSNKSEEAIYYEKI